MKEMTIKKAVSMSGIGLHKGLGVNMTLEPQSEGRGISFFRSDLNINIPLNPNNIVDTTLATVLGLPDNPNARVSTIEHLLSAVHAYNIDNLRIVLDGEEVPIMDGSSITHCILLDEAGVITQNAFKKIMVIKKPLEVRDGDKFVRIEPHTSSIFDFKINFNHPAIRSQHYLFTYSLSAYKNEISRARTFGFLKEVNHLRALGLAKGGSLDNCIVLDDDGVVNKGGLRYENEFVRHKILDAIGDMSIIGMPIVGAYISFAGSHKLNHLLTKEILSHQDSYEIIEVRDSDKHYDRVLSMERELT